MKRWRRASFHAGDPPSCGVVPTAVNMSNEEGDLLLLWNAASDPPSGWVIDIVDCATGTFIDSTATPPGSDRQLTIVGMVPGSWKARIRDQDSTEACWVYSNCAEFN